MSIIWDWCNRLGNAGLGVNNMGFPRLDRLSLQVDMDTLLLGLALLNGVFLDAVDEFLSRARVGDVFNTDVDALLHVTVSDSLVNDNTNSGFGHVIDHSGLAVVDFVGHTKSHFSIWLLYDLFLLHLISVPLSCAMVLNRYENH